MAHFAKLDENSIVVFVCHGRDEDTETNLTQQTSDTYKQTSYNTRGGVYYIANTNDPSSDQTKAFRKNYAGIGYTYDSTRDAFIPPKPFDSWLLNEDTCLWEAPVPYPNTGDLYHWDESVLNWVLTENG
jgi:hypothetical protein